MVTENQRVLDVAAALRAGDLGAVGPLLLASHASLRDDFEVSTPTVDGLVEKAWSQPGCLGARIMGAGFGGSIIALLERGKEDTFVSAMGRPVILCATADGAFATAA